MERASAVGKLAGILAYSRSSWRASVRGLSLSVPGSARLDLRGIHAMFSMYRRLKLWPDTLILQRMEFSTRFRCVEKDVNMPRLSGATTSGMVVSYMADRVRANIFSS